MSSFNDNLCDRLRIAHIQCVTSHSLAKGVYLRFAYTDDNDVFSAGRDAIKDLPTLWRAWRPDERVWWISETGFYSLAQDVPCVAQALDAFDRQHERAEAQHGSHTQHTRTGKVPDDVARAFAALYVTTDAPLQIVLAAKRALALIHHPDLGGDLETMKRINTSADICEDYIMSHAHSRTK